MSNPTDENLVVGLDIGTSKIAAVIGHKNSDQSISVIGSAVAESTGLKDGVVVNISNTVFGIRRAVEGAELMSECQVQSVFAGIAGAHISGANSHGAIPLKNQEVSASDIPEVLSAARGIAIPADKVLLHSIPQNYLVDGQKLIMSPLGMSGHRLEANVHLITMSRNAALNVQKCVENANLQTERLVLEQLASSEAVLSNDDKQLGVCLIDIGAGTTDVLVYKEGAIAHTLSIPMAGNTITEHLALALRTTVPEADKVKMSYASALIQLANSEKEIPVPNTMGGVSKSITERSLAEVVEPLYDELLTKVRNTLRENNLEDHLNAGLVFTGGGSKIRGLLDLAEDVFHMPARIGKPVGTMGSTDSVDDPIYTTAVGLLKYGIMYEPPKARPVQQAQQPVPQPTVTETTQAAPRPTPQPIQEPDEMASMATEHQPAYHQQDHSGPIEGKVGGMKRWIKDNF